MATKKPQGVMRTFRYPLHPTKAQADVLGSWLESCRQLYNGALQERRDAWRRCGVSVTYNMQTMGLAELRREPEWKAIPSDVERSSIARVDRAFKAFFRRLRAGEKPGYPRFKSRDQYGSIGLGPYVPVRGNSVHVPKLGLVRFNQYRPIKGKVLNVEVRKDCGKWFVCFQCDLGEAPAKAAPSSAVGIDLGLTHFATLSNGEQVKNPRLGQRSQAILANRQRSLARKKRGSTSRKRAKIAVARALRKIKNRRVDFGRKLACRLFERFDFIAYEDLSIARMIHGNLAKSIHDAAWGAFIGILACKAESAGKHLIPVDPRGTSQRCSSCGQVVQKTLAERVHRCTCGLTMDRDHNAARNIVLLGMSMAEMAEVQSRTMPNLPEGTQ